MSLNNGAVRLKGECDKCGKLETRVTLEFGNLWLCDTCLKDERKIAADNYVEKTIELNTVLEQTRKQDASVELKQDVYNAEIMQAHELKAAVFAQEGITEEQKQEIYAELLFERFQHMQSTVMEDRKKLEEDQTKLRARQSAAQQATLLLKAEIAAKYRLLDINYKPEKPTRVKSPERKSSGKKPETTRRVAPKTTEIDAALAKVGIEPNLTNQGAVKSIWHGNENMTIDEAATTLKSWMAMKPVKN